MSKNPVGPFLTTLPFDIEIFLDKWKFGWGSGTEEEAARERRLMCQDLLVLARLVRGEQAFLRILEQAKSPLRGRFSSLR